MQNKLREFQNFGIFSFAGVIYFYFSKFEKTFKIKKL